jgi:uncharacterized phage protein (TIGR01671 family)
MREIKFRGWHTKANKMFSAEEMAADQLTLLPTGSFINVNGDSTALSTTYDRSKFIPLQWTGLKDKNGKEIYEGDLLRYPGHPENFTAYEVFFHDGDANSSYDIGYCLARTHNHGNIAGCLIPSFKPKTTAQMEVLGNIYEHPHLLKKEM